MVVYEVCFNEAEGRWVLLRSGIPFSVHETLEDANVAAREHAATESDAEHRNCRVIWNRQDGSRGGEWEYGEAIAELAPHVRETDL